MRLRPIRRSSAAPARRGSALLMSFLVLIVLAAIVFQLFITTSTDARIARNDVALTTMDQAIESALLEVYDRLGTDAESGAADGAGATMPGSQPASPDGDAPGGGGGAGGAPAGPVDSREDSWGKPQRTTIGEIELRILVQDEDAKINVLGMLTEDEEEAQKAFDRVVRVLDLCREGTVDDIDLTDARRMAEDMREYFTSRDDAILPRGEQLTYDEEKQDVGLPMGLEELAVLENFHLGHFRDYRDDDGAIVHSIGAFITVWSSLQTHEDMEGARSAGDDPGSTPAAPSTPDPDPDVDPDSDPDSESDPERPDSSGAPGGEAGGSATDKAGIAVNINTAPAAVLHALMDDRDVSGRFWDDVIEYRNLEEEDGEGEEDEEPVLDENGEEVIQRQIFDSLDELDEVPGFDRLETDVERELRSLLTTESQVFSIYVSARRATGLQDDFGGYRGAQREREKEDLLGNALVRTVRSVVWRYQDGEEWKIVPLVRWQIVDYTPFEVLDYPDPDR